MGEHTLNGYLRAGKQLMIRDTGCTIREYLEIMSQTFGNFNLPSPFTSTSASANVTRSDFADAVADASAAAVACKEFKYAPKSDTDAASLLLESVSASALAISLEVLPMHKKIDWRALFAHSCSWLLKRILDRASTYKERK